MANVKQMKKIAPLTTRQTSLIQNVCELMFGVRVKGGVL